MAILNEKQIESARAIGKYWEGRAHRRIYLPQKTVCELIGLAVNRYGTGNVSNAALSGRSVSNSEASRILNRIDRARAYVDANSGKIVFTSAELEDFESEIEQNINNVFAN